MIARKRVINPDYGPCSIEIFASQECEVSRISVVGVAYNLCAGQNSDRGDEFSKIRRFAELLENHFENHPDEGDFYLQIEGVDIYYRDSEVSQVGYEVRVIDLGELGGSQYIRVDIPECTTMLYELVKRFMKEAEVESS